MRFIRIIWAFKKVILSQKKNNSHKIWPFCPDLLRVGAFFFTTANFSLASVYTYSDPLEPKNLIQDTLRL